MFYDIKTKHTCAIAARGRNRRGVTFLEILMVISIMAIMFLVATPRLKGTFLQNELVTTTRDLARLMRLARSEAVYSDKPVPLRINLDDAWYQLSLPPRDDDKDTSSYRGQEKRRSEVEQKRYLPLDVEFAEITTDAPPDPENDNIVRLIFFPNGTATASTIILEGRKGNAMTIDLAPSTGYSRVYKGRPEK